MTTMDRLVFLPGLSTTKIENERLVYQHFHINPHVLSGTKNIENGIMPPPPTGNGPGPEP